LQNTIMNIISNKEKIQNIYICSNNEYEKYL